jgi:hypothetical protein
VLLHTVKPLLSVVKSLLSVVKSLATDTARRCCSIQ